MNHRFNICFRILLGVSTSLMVSCVPLLSVITGTPYKKVRVVDESGNPIKDAGTQGVPFAEPRIAHLSDEKGYLYILQRQDPILRCPVLIYQGGFAGFAELFDNIENGQIIVLKRMPKKAVSRNHKLYNEWRTHYE